MRNFRNVAFGLIGAAAVASASDVHELKKDTFDSFVKDHDLVLAECKSLSRRRPVSPSSSFEHTANVISRVVFAVCHPNPCRENVRVHC